ncbi:acyl carrier protein [Streptomyces sp. NPDC057654]|uniref:acyl carrier protein n=1 Tax=Streptomyces sp. NPDC057654 TaxID=3346196 RepID=UPI0036A9FCEF
MRALANVPENEPENEPRSERQMVHDIVVDLLVSAFEVDPGHIRDDASLEALGLDSVAQVELADRVGESLGVDIPEEEFTGQATLKNIVESAERKQVTPS